jgi:hypothetical protein
MPTPSRKFNSVRATRLSLLLFISLTAGLGTAIFGPLNLAQHGQPVQASQPLTSQDSATADSSGSWSGPNSDAEFGGQGTIPQVVQHTRNHVMTTTRAS